MMLEFPGATAIVLISLAMFGLIAAHTGMAAFTLLLRQSLHPPASMRLALFVSRMNGAMKRAQPFASPMPAQMSVPDTPRFELRNSVRNTYSP